MSSTGETPTAKPDSADVRAAWESPPGQLLRQAQLLLKEAQLLVDQAVVVERLKGTSWEIIGGEVGRVSKSAAQKRYGPRVNAWVDEHFPNETVTAKVAFATAYETLHTGWKTAGNIVEAQKLFIALTKTSASLWESDEAKHVQAGRDFVTKFLSAPIQVRKITGDSAALPVRGESSQAAEERSGKSVKPASDEEGRSLSLEERLTALERRVQLLSERDEDVDRLRGSPPVIGL